jgi:hypothetical protein
MTKHPTFLSNPSERHLLGRLALALEARRRCHAPTGSLVDAMLY